MAMTDKTAPGVSSEIVDVEAICSVEELCLACNVDAEWIAELVEHGAIEPFGQTRSEWQFASLSVVRVAKAKRLERLSSTRQAWRSCSIFSMRSTICGLDWGQLRGQRPCRKIDRWQIQGPHCCLACSSDQGQLNRLASHDMSCCN